MKKAKAPPKPRVCYYMTMRVEATINEDGTWLEPEEFCYPHGGFTRRAYAQFPDGKLRLVRCSITDTFFSIPGFARINGKRVRGFLSSNDAGGLKFTPFAKKAEKPNAS
jgi:hypothetical protein